jgi:hypothetical protein
MCVLQWFLQLAQSRARDSDALVRATMDALGVLSPSASASVAVPAPATADILTIQHDSRDAAVPPTLPLRSSAAASTGRGIHDSAADRAAAVGDGDADILTIRHDSRDAAVPPTLPLRSSAATSTGRGMHDTTVGAAALGDADTDGSGAAAAAAGGGSRVGAAFALANGLSAGEQGRGARPLSSRERRLRSSRPTTAEDRRAAAAATSTVTVHDPGRRHMRHAVSRVASSLLPGRVG